MAEDDSTGKVDLRLVAEIVGGYVAKNSIAVDQQTTREHVARRFQLFVKIR